MTEYRRNPTMVICIIAVMAVGAIVVGLLATGESGWGWIGHHGVNTTYVFESNDSIQGPVKLNIDLDVGDVNVRFSDNTSLLYKIVMTVDNSTIASHGEPSVTLVSGTIGLSYTVADVNVTLSTGVNYTLSISADTGMISVILSDGAHIGNMTLSVDTGNINLAMTTDVVIHGQTTFSLVTNTGDITAVVTLPASVGGSFSGTSSVGSVSITPVGWDEISENHYQTSDYSTADDTLTITASTNVGSITATLT